MRTFHWLLSLCVTLSFSAAFVGCNSESGDFEETGDAPPDQAQDEPHAHPHEGPHDGSLIELGNEEYHGELVHDEKTGAVTIYILDGHVENAVPIAASEITINLTHDGEAEQFKLAASPDEGDPEGKSSRFVSDDEHLSEDLDHDDVKARLVLEIDGKSFAGDIAHDHDHDEGHDDHDEDDEDEDHHKDGDDDDKNHKDKE